MGKTPPSSTDLNTRIASLQQQLEQTADPYERLPLLDRISFRLCLVDAAEAGRYAVEEQRLAFALGDKYWIMKSWLRRADSAQSRSQHALAQRYFGRAWKLLEELPDNAADKAHVRRNLGAIYYALGRTPEAMKILESALGLARTSGVQSEIAATLSIFGRVCMNVGLYGRAWELCREGMEIHEARGFVSGIAVSMSEIGNIHALLEDRERALESYRNALRLHRKVGNKYGQAYACASMGEVYGAQGRFGPALRAYTNALELSEQGGYLFLHAEVCKGIAHIHILQGNHDEAFVHLKQAEKEFRALNNAPGKSLVLLELGEVFVARRKWKKAISSLIESQQTLSTWNIRSRETRLHALLAQAYEGCGELRKSLEHYKLFMAFEKELLQDEVRREIVAGQFRDQIRKMERERALDRAKTNRLEKEIDHQQKEVTTLSLRIAQNDELLEELRTRLVNLRHANGHTLPLINDIIREIDYRTGRVDAWNVFERQLRTLDHDFVQHLIAACSSLTPSEMRICSLLRVNMSNKEIAMLLNLSERTVDTHRTRIRRKLRLPRKESLIGFLSGM